MSKLSKTMEALSDEFGVFFLVARLGDKDPHGPGEPRQYAVLTNFAGDTDGKAMAQVRQVVEKWLRSEAKA